MVTSKERTRVALLGLALGYSVVPLRSVHKPIPYEDSKHMCQSNKIKLPFSFARYLLTYQEPIPCEQLVTRLCDLKQQYTQAGGKLFILLKINMLSFCFMFFPYSQFNITRTVQKILLRRVLSDRYRITQEKFQYDRV